MVESSLKAKAAVIVKDGMGAILTYLLRPTDSDGSCLQNVSAVGGTSGSCGCGGGDDESVSDGNFLHESQESW